MPFELIRRSRTSTHYYPVHQYLPLSHIHQSARLYQSIHHFMRTLFISNYSMSTNLARNIISSFNNLTAFQFPKGFMERNSKAGNSTKKISLFFFMTIFFLSSITLSSSSLSYISLCNYFLFNDCSY